jgi:hypothetical protein
LSLPALTSEFLNTYAIKIWERIRFARITNQKITETTITENLIFDFWYHAKHNDLAIEVYEAKEESRNGTDFEIFVETKYGYILMACQAKLLKNGKYPKISYQSGGHYQIDRLLEYAEQMQGHPCYLFYNYYNNHLLKEKLNQNDTYLPIHYGLTCCDANRIKNDYFKPAQIRLGKRRIKIPSFDDLHPNYSFPLSKMIDLITSECLVEVLNIFITEKADVPIRFYTHEEVRNTHPWAPVIPWQTISGLPAKKEEHMQPYPEINTANFHPKYRLVLSNEKVRQLIFRVT